MSAKHCLFRQNKHQQKPFRTLNHPYTMKIALITKTLKKKTVPPQIIIHLQHKKPTESETLKLVPIFNDR